MKGKQFNNPNQLDAFRDFDAIKSNSVEELKDSQGRTRKNIEDASKSLKPEVLNSITFKNGQWYIEGKLADEWISEDEDLFTKDSKEYWKN